MGFTGDDVHTRLSLVVKVIFSAFQEVILLTIFSFTTIKETSKVYFGLNVLNKVLLEYLILPAKIVS